MKASEAKELFLQLTESFFDGYTVAYANQSRTAKPELPLVTLVPGNVHRPQAANHEIEDGILVGYYLSRMPVVVDLFTNGTPVEDEDGDTVAYANSAMDEMLTFADFLNSPKCISWCHENDVSILIEADAQDLTGAVNDTNYEYRARLEVLFSFTQETEQSLGDMGYFEFTAIAEES